MSQNWETLPLWAMVEVRRETVEPADLGMEVVHYSIPLVDAFGTGQIERTESIDSAKLRLRGGEVLISKLNPRKSRVVHVKPSELPVVSSTEFVGLRPGTGLIARHLAYFLQSELVRQGLNAKVQSVTRSHQRVSPEDIVRLRLPLPAVEEQRRIADFLDAETARIDQLQSKNGQLIRLLHERRQATIDYEVELSSNTLVKLFWQLSLLRDGTHQPPPRVDAGVPILTARNISSGVLRLTEYDTHVSETDANILEKSLRLRTGDILLSVKGTIGACVVTPDGFPRVVLDRNVALLRPGYGYLSTWLAFVLRSTRLQEQMKLSVTAAAQPGMPLGVIRELKVPEVSPDEQAIRQSRLVTRCGKIDEIVGRLEHKRLFLAERRQALITAAVTGQFDVTAASGRGVTP